MNDVKKKRHIHSSVENLYTLFKRIAQTRRRKVRSLVSLCAFELQSIHTMFWNNNFTMKIDSKLVKKVTRTELIGSTSARLQLSQHTITKLFLLQPSPLSVKL